MIRTLQGLMFASLLAYSSNVWAGGIGVVNFQEAVLKVKEGKAAKSKLDAQFATKRKEVEKMDKELKEKYEAYKKQKDLLDPKVQKEQEMQLYQMQMQLQQTAMAYEQEMQMVWAKELEVLVGKMKSLSGDLGKEKNLDLVLEINESGLIYRSSSVSDITQELIMRYDSKYGG